MNAPAPTDRLALAPRAELDRLFALQRAAFEHERFPVFATRRERLQRLYTMTADNEQRLVDAIAQDFGHRSAYETRWTDSYVVTAAIRHAQRHLKRWMKAV